MEEIWKDIYYVDNKDNKIIDYRGKYQVSNLGNVKSLNYKQTKKERLLKFFKDKRGYLKVQLWKNNNYQTFLVHRLVAFMFIKNDDTINKTQVNHINEFEKDNNRVENLEWCTDEYNRNYGTHNKRVGEKLKNRKDQSIQVISINIENGEINKYLSVNDTSNYGFIPTKVSACCKGNRKTHGKCKWYYLKDYLNMAIPSEASSETTGTCND